MLAEGNKKVRVYLVIVSNVRRNGSERNNVELKTKACY